MLKDIHINLETLKSDTLHESAVVRMAADLKYLLFHMAGPSANLFPRGVKVSGSRVDLQNFSRVMAKEKNYMDSYLKHGLNDPRVLNDRHKLEKAIFNFEKETGIKWPFK